MNSSSVTSHLHNGMAESSLFHWVAIMQLVLL